MTDEIDRFVNGYVEAIRDENAAVFAGAGLSIPCGLVDWASLLRDIAVEIGLNVDKETDLISVAQFHENERGGRHGINQALINEFAERSDITINHTILAALPIRTYWTTNYDKLLEESLRRVQKRVDVKIVEKNIATMLPRRDVVVYKMHGDISLPDEAVVTRDDYESYGTTHPLFSTALQGDLVSKRFLFIGFSFSDPNVGYLLSRIRLILGKDRPEHHCLLRDVHPDDFPSDEDYIYARARQNLQVKDLKRFGIQALLVQSYGQYTVVLKKIAEQFRRRRVFVSGSAATYAPMGDLAGEEFLRLLGAALIEKGLDVVTGFGLGVGPYLLNGVLEGLEAESTHSFHDRVTLRPFPQGISDAASRAQRWRKYRTDMIGTAGIAVFVFGNRKNGDEVEAASGVIEEFELAKEAGLVLVPVGSTGYVARELHRRVLLDYEALFPGLPQLRNRLEELGTETDQGTLVSRVVSLVATIAKGA